MKEPMDCTRGGKCSRCGGCCSSILPLTKDEMLRLRKYAAEHGIRPRIPEGDTVVYMHCPFLQPAHGVMTARCLAYDVRPDVCRVFDCSNTNEQNGRAWAEKHDAPPPDPTNAWAIFGKTGLRLKGQEIPYALAPLCRVQTDKGEVHEFRIGRPVKLTLASGREMAWAMVLGFDESGIQVFDGEAGEAVHVKFEQIADAQH